MQGWGKGRHPDTVETSILLFIVLYVIKRTTQNTKLFGATCVGRGAAKHTHTHNIWLYTAACNCREVSMHYYILAGIHSIVTVICSRNECPFVLTGICNSIVPSCGWRGHTSVKGAPGMQKVRLKNWSEQGSVACFASKIKLSSCCNNTQGMFTCWCTTPRV